jgi:uncharacterized protein YrrD
MSPTKVEMVSLVGLLGKKVIARDTAEEIGELQGVVVDAPAGRVLAWQVGKGRKARVVAHEHITGIGDAVVVDAEASVREPADGVEAETVKGHGALLDSLVLADDGTELGTVSDVLVDTDRGALGAVTADSHPVEPKRFRALGSYALVVAAT